MTTVFLDNEKAHSIAHSNETALAITEAMKDRERNRLYTDILRTRKLLVGKKLKIVEADYIKYWKDMQAAEFGSIVYGRGGNPDRFAWNYNLKDFASAALRDPNKDPVVEAAPVTFSQTSISSLPSKKKSRGRPKGSKNKNPRGKKQGLKMSVAEHRVITLKLRPRMQMDVIIPNDITKSELTKVAEALKSI